MSLPMLRKPVFARRRGMPRIAPTGKHFFIFLKGFTGDASADGPSSGQLDVNLSGEAAPIY